LSKEDEEERDEIKKNEVL